MTSESFDEVTICRGRRHRDGRRPAVLPGLRICLECRDRLEKDLVGLPTWYESSWNVSDIRHSRLVDRGNGRPSRGAVLGDAVVKVRSDILGTLASWCGLVVDERGVLGPNQLDIRQLATFLAIHLGWLTAHPAAPDLADELADLTDAADRIVLRGRPGPGDHGAELDRPPANDGAE